MEKLNELKEAFYPQYGTPGSRDMDVTARRKVIDENIEAVAEAFRALEQEVKHHLNVITLISKQHNRTVVERDDWKQRAEAAEAKLAELAKQEPVAYVMGEETIDDFNSGYEFFAVRDAEHEEEMESIPLFTRPAPAVSLANWIECSERLPQDREQVILWDSDIGEHTSGHYSQQTGKFYSTGMIIDNEITHWLPAPAAPEVE